MNLKLKRTPGIFLIGFMGSGKSTVGRILAERIGWHFADLDEDIEKSENTTITELFRTRGEVEFRAVESAALAKRVRRIQCGTPTVIALGGGAFTQEKNIELIHANGVSIWLDTPFPIIERRVGLSNHRPLAQDPEKFRELYSTRRAWYEKADYTIEITRDDSRSAVEQILTLPPICD